MKLIVILLLTSFFHCDGRQTLITDTNKTNQEMEINLHKAVETNDLKMLTTLLNRNPNLEVKDDKGRTPLMRATYNNNYEIAKKLIVAGANVNAQDDILNSPFLYAGATGYIDILKLCLQHGADFNIFNRYGGSALIPAAEKRHVEIVQILTQTPNYPINHVNNLGWTALLEAIILGSRSQKQIEIVQILVDAGADFTIADFDGVTPLQHAKRNSLHEIAHILENAGAIK